MQIRKFISKPFRHDADGTSVVGGVNVVVSASVDEPGETRTHVSSKQRIVQRNGRTEVVEERHSSSDMTDNPEHKEESE